MSDIQTVDAEALTTSSIVDYMVERQAATDRRKRGEPAPWSEDPIIGKYFLCSVVRDEDRTSILARKYIQSAPTADQIPLAATFRYFNHVPTLADVYENGALGDAEKTEYILEQRKKNGEKNFSTAYKINPPSGGIWSSSGVAAITARLAKTRYTTMHKSARDTVRDLISIKVGPFIAYQVMQDLRWVRGSYDDELTWAFVGPGAARGLLRLAGTYGGHRTADERRNDNARIAMKTTTMPGYMKEPMLAILNEARERLGSHINLFEIEHNLCEVDKYYRIKTGETKGRKFTPKADLPK